MDNSNVFEKYGVPSLNIVNEIGTDAFIPMEDGVQTVIVSEISFFENKNKNGVVASAKLTVSGGKYDGRYVKTFMNVVHENKTAQEIGIKEFLRFATACGYTSETAGFDSELYVGKELKVIIGKEAPNAEGIVYNKVVGYMPVADEETDSEKTTD